MRITTASLCLAVCLGLSTTVALLGLTGCAGDRYNRSTGEYIDDKSLTSRVNSALGDNTEYKFEGVKVNTFKGTVQLSGFVDMSAQKSKAEDIVKQVQGVKNVENDITVRDQNERTGHRVDDKTLNSQVKSTLADSSEYKFDEVVVSTSQGTVQLSGFVNTADQKSKAGDLARNIPGVQDVVNNITVKDKL